MATQGNKAVYPRDLYHQGQWRPIQRGINLREYYGGLALIGILASGQYPEHTDEAVDARKAWRLAAAMVNHHPYAEA